MRHAMRSHLAARLLAPAAVLSALALSALGAPRVAAAQLVPTQLTFFGDSFTDTGNGDILSIGAGLGDLTPSPPFATGVVSDGPNWANYFAQALGLGGQSGPSLAPPPFTGRNYAIGTARTGAFGGFGPAPIGMASQVAGYVGGGNATQATGLAVLFGGALDVFDASLLASAALRTAALATAAQNVAMQVVGLYGTGARNFLVPSLPNVGRSPQGLATGPQGSALLGQLTAEYNTLLGTALAQLQPLTPQANILGLRLDNLFGNILADVATGGTKYGFTNATVPCIALPSCAGSVFFDPLHPTTAAHQLIAQAAFARVVQGVDVSAVPEPSTVVLVGAGLIVLGGVVRRRVG
jgi:outer membrane lipase/esterase